ncbi:MAG TPA: 4-hydroxythreonine-4-phosphate dehydrogenase PdxA [Hanamia sp.]|nr:4-hydroxythreonine-4-phosphate dehydrogenase PdxA [Hanamia sp.]
MSNNIQTENKPVIGFSTGDLNGIGIELIIKTLSDNRMLEFLTPVIFASNKVINFYRKSIPEINFNFASVKDFNKLNPKQINIYNCWEEEVGISPGELNETGGKYAIKSLKASTDALKNGIIDALVTAPIHKKNVHSTDFPYTGHTPFFKDFFQQQDVVMILAAGNFRVGLVTEHVALKDVAALITKEGILSKINILHASLRRDFNIEKPKIGVLALNPHAGDEGLIGSEEMEIIRPAVLEAKHYNMIVSGPFSADAFFARNYQNKFDAVLAMYHDQGLIPLKSLAFGEGINFTAGLPYVRTSPDHGTAFDIAGKNKADCSSFTAATFAALDFIKNRSYFDEIHSNPLKKLSSQIVAGGPDE